ACPNLKWNDFDVVPAVAIRHVVAGEGAHHCAHGSGGFPSVAFADLIADESTGQAAQDRTAIVARARTTRLVDPLAGAFLVGNGHAFVSRLHAADGGVIGVRLVVSSGGGG